jgi:hypothetical protein
LWQRFLPIKTPPKSLPQTPPQISHNPKIFTIQTVPFYWRIKLIGILKTQSSSRNYVK